MKVDRIIKRKLERAYWFDQILRRLFINSKSRLVRLALSIFIFWFDKSNRKTFTKIVNSYGWPSSHIHGIKATEAAFFIMQHSPKPFIEEYIGLLRNAVCQHRADKIHLATAQDRLLMYRGKNQIYGTQIRTVQAHGRKSDYFWPIVNAKKVNKRRKMIGFQTTLEEYAAQSGISL